MFKKLLKTFAAIFMFFCISSARAMEEEAMDTPSQYFVILQKAYQGDPKSIDGLHDALRRLKERSHPGDYEKELNQLYSQALNQEVSSKIFAELIKKFIINEKYRLCPSPLTDFDDNFHRTLWTSLTAEERQKIQKMREAAQGQ
ncbi:MAG: hypothetical protein K2Y08_03870 [Alphaproteobacteria bacterium]|nr:hypothetical protein [Alphaproteobacteria bacterium]